MNETKLVTFLDLLGRTVIGEESPTSNTEFLVVKNPALIHIAPDNATGQIRLQILPLFFKEFLADKEAPTVWNYRRANITESEPITYDFKVAAQYQQMFSNSQVITPQQPTGQNTTPKIKLFDEVK